MTLRVPFVALSLLALALSGCFGGDGGLVEPGTGFKETGRTIHLKMTVVDLDSQGIFPGYAANLWAFCVEPFDANDEVAKAAIDYRVPLATDSQTLVGTPLEGKCSVPGPTIRVRQGDKVKVDFSHSHVHPHTIHWHGQFVDYEADGAPGVSQAPVESGQSFTYEFVAKKAGTLWYHCHVDTQLHVMQGLYGMFIVEPQSKKGEPKGVDQDYSLVFSTLNAGWVWDQNPKHQHGVCQISGQPNCENPPIDAKADVFMVNGHSYPYTMQQEGTLVKVKEGDKVRLRLLNAGTTVETIHPHGHDMLVTHRDGSPLESPYYVDTLTIGPAERYDVVFEANNPGPWMIHTHVNDHETNCGKAPGGMHTMIVYEGYDMHGFQAELPATCEYLRPVPIPDDVQVDRSFPLGTAAALPGGLPSPVPPSTVAIQAEVAEMCTVRSITFRATLHSPAGSAPNFNSVRLDVIDPTGQNIATKTLTQGGESYTARFPIESLPLNQMEEGNYTFQASGTSSQATLDLSAAVDHFESYRLAEADSHRIDGMGPPPCTKPYQLAGSPVYEA